MIILSLPGSGCLPLALLFYFYITYTSRSKLITDRRLSSRHCYRLQPNGMSKSQDQIWQEEVAASAARERLTRKFASMCDTKLRMSVKWVDGAVCTEWLSRLVEDTSGRYENWVIHGFGEISGKTMNRIYKKTKERLYKE